MRKLIALGLWLLATPAFAEGGPDSVRVCGPTGCHYVNQSAEARHARQAKSAQIVPSRKTRVAGKKFRTSPVTATVSSGAHWIGVGRRYVGATGKTLRVKHARRWCGEFMALVAEKAGIKKPDGYAKASKWVNAGTRLSGPVVGAIAVYQHHVGIVTAVNSDGSIHLLSGNYNDRVYDGPYRNRGLIAYVWPHA